MAVPSPMVIQRLVSLAMGHQIGWQCHRSRDGDDHPVIPPKTQASGKERRCTALGVAVPTTVPMVSSPALRIKMAMAPPYQRW
jgi:hypothetical protein